MQSESSDVFLVFKMLKYYIIFTKTKGVLQNT
jgi:hypothetical protein